MKPIHFVKATTTTTTTKTVSSSQNLLEETSPLGQIYSEMPSPKRRPRKSTSSSSSTTTTIPSSSISCDSCQKFDIPVPPGSTKRQARIDHVSSLPHILASSSAQKPPPPVFAIDKSNIGFQLLKRNGWKEGSGLGADESGRVAPIATRLKNDKFGIGSGSASKKRITHTHKDIMETSLSTTSQSQQIPFKKHLEDVKRDQESRKVLLQYLKT